MPTIPETKKVNTVALGMAVFSMFFGSGNVVFPVVIGQATGSQCPFAVAGLVITAILIPLLGLVTLSLYDGSYRDFFCRLGRVPGFLIIGMIMALIGPLAVIPRCVVIAHSAITALYPEVELVPFSALSMALTFFFTVQRGQILDLLGRVLTPLLLLSLIVIIGQGLVVSEGWESSLSWHQAFSIGLVEGYNTMDLFAAFMFASVVLNEIRQVDKDLLKNNRMLFSLYLRASAIGMGLLTSVYCGICVVAARHLSHLQFSGPEQLLGALVLSIMGPSAGLVVCVTVSLACLTTAISLAVVFSDFLAIEVAANKISYRLALVLTLVVSFLVSTLQFAGIQELLVPLLKLTLPALIVLTLANLLHKLAGIKMVKTPVAIAFLLTIMSHYCT